MNLDNESNFLIAMSSLFHSLTVEGINDELVIESLQKGTIKLSPFRKGYMVVLWIVGGTRWRKYSGPIPHFILKNNWSVSQPVSAYTYSDFVKMGKPVAILAASNWSFFLICLNSQFHNYPRLHKHIQKGGECRLNTCVLSWIYLGWILISVIYLNVWLYLLSYFLKCSFHFAFWERIAPRCLWLVDKGIFLPGLVND